MKIFKYTVSATFLALAVLYMAHIIEPTAFMSFFMALILTVIFLGVDIEIDLDLRKKRKK